MLAKRLACVAASLLYGVPTSAYGWGATGHRLIGVVAIAALPDEVPAFLHTREVARQEGELAREPDRWRGAGAAHDSERDPAHFVNVDDDQTILGGPSLAHLPPTRGEYDTALRAVGATQYRAGYLPYAIVDGFEQLKSDFAFWRADVAGASFAKTEKARDWFEKDRELRELLAIRDLGVWAHFVGDGSQPLHVSAHFDGWGNFPNPERFSTARGIHAQFEGAFVRANVKESDVASRLPAARTCSCTIESRTAEFLAASNAQVVTFYRLQKASDFDTPTAQGTAFAAQRLAAGAGELRDMIVDAWRQSADTKIGYPPVGVSDIESGRIDALGPLEGED